MNMASNDHGSDRTDGGRRGGFSEAALADLFRGRRAVLVVGCGEGSFLGLLRDRGVAAVGIDERPLPVLAARREGFEAETLDPRRVANLPGLFDGIHVSNVVERMDGLTAARFLEDCVRKLEPGGILVLRSSNAADATAFWDDPGRVRPYPPGALETMVLSAGLSIVRTGSGDEPFVVAESAAAPEPATTGGAACAPAVPSPITAGPGRKGGKTPVVFEGAFFATHSFAIVNREMASGLLASGRVDLSLAPVSAHDFGPERDPKKLGPVWDALGAPLRGPAAVHVRHRFPPDFSAPPSGALVVWQPWEFGAVPKAWIGPIRTTVDEVWAPSEYVARCFERSGVPRERIAFVPYGVDLERFAPGIRPAALATKKRFKFLFVGGSLWRKGVDLLLRAYRTTFHRDDDVCLVVKELGADSFYRGQNLLGEIEAMSRDEAAPEILVLREPRDHSDMPALYAAADCLVHPYRGEGFALPVAEAMACGKPAIVTRGGATDDFVGDDCGFRIPGRPIAVNVELELAGNGEVIEPDLDALVRALREAYARPDEVARRGQAARRRAEETLSWKRAAEIAARRIEALASRAPVRATSPAGATVPAAAAAAARPDPMEEMETRLREIYAGGTAADAKDPAVADAHRTLARYYADRGEYESARRHFERLTDLEPASWEWHNSLGLLAVLGGLNTEAEARFRKALELNPDSASVHYNLGVLHHNLDRKRDAIASFRRALALGAEDAEILNNLGVLLFETGDPAEAERWLKRAVELDGAYSEARINLATVLDRAGRTEEARRHAEAVLQIEPGHAEALAFVSEK